MDDDGRITDLEAIPDDTTFLFRVGGDGTDGEREAILVRSNDTVECWLNECQHMTHVPLDKGTGATMRNGEIVCENHGAYFEAETGRCTHGPCEGAYLRDLEVTVDGGTVYLTDGEFTVVGIGPKERDDVDRVSKSNVEF